MMFDNPVVRRGVICIVLIFGATSLAANWPQWRGPRRDGLSKETGLRQEWPEEGPTLLWQREELGTGYSTPAVVDGRIYLVSSKGLENEFVQALDAADGEPIWSRRLGNVGHPEQEPPYPGARSTPTIDGELIYALGSDGDLVCLETANGNVRWQKNLRRDFGGKYGEWAYSESPLIDGDVLVCTPGGKEATLLALNKHTGDVIWKSAVPEGDDAGYASAVIANVGRVKQYIQFLGDGLVGVRADNGEFLWRYDRTAQGPASIPTPIVDENFVYTSAHARGGAALLRLTAKNGGVTAEEVYFDPKLPTAIGGAVVVDGYIYGTSGPTTVCAELRSGKIQWTENRGIAPASVCYADGRLYFHGENGDVALVEATPQAYRQRGYFTPPSQPDRGKSKAWAYPVVADGRLYVHDFGTLWCYDVKAPVVAR